MSGRMDSELECGVCYRMYNAGRRCPRELQCKHSFCESCLRALLKPQGANEARPGPNRSIVCPLCRHATSISEEGSVKAELRVDEGALERLMSVGVLDREGDDPEEEEEDGRRGSEEEATLSDTTAEESEVFSDSRGGRLRRSWRKVWRKISGKSLQQRNTDGGFLNYFIDTVTIHMYTLQNMYNNRYNLHKQKKKSFKKVKLKEIYNYIFSFV